MITMNLMIDKLKCHHGSEAFYTGWNKACIYTDGFKDLMGMAECYWLYDIIQTEIHASLMLHDVMDTFYLHLKTEDGKMALKLVDYQDLVIWRRNIDFTTFPEGALMLIVGWDGKRTTTCLFSER